MREGKAGPTVNGGFYVCRANARTEEFFQAVSSFLETRPTVIDQDAINALLPGTESGLRWVHLPLSYYARTHGWPPPRHLFVYHANATTGADNLQQKVRQFAELEWIRHHGWPAVLWSSLAKILKRLHRLAGLAPHAE